MYNLQSSFPYQDRQHRQGPQASTIPAPLSAGGQRYWLRGRWPGYGCQVGAGSELGLRPSTWRAGMPNRGILAHSEVSQVPPQPTALLGEHRCEGGAPSPLGTKDPCPGLDVHPGRGSCRKRKRAGRTFFPRAPLLYAHLPPLHLSEKTCSHPPHPHPTPALLKES